LIGLAIWEIPEIDNFDIVEGKFKGGERNITEMWIFFS